MDPISFDWYDDADFPIGVAEAALVSRELHVKLGDWASDAESHMFQDEGSAVWNEWIILWTDRGRSLARAVSEELGRPVSYHNQLTEEIEEINFPAPPPTGRRHHRRHRD